MKKKQDIEDNDSRWNVTWKQGYGDRPPPITKQETIQDVNVEPYVGRKRIAFKDAENVWIFKWSKLGTDKKKRSIDHWERPGEQTRWEDMIDE